MSAVAVEPSTAVALLNGRRGLSARSLDVNETRPMGMVRGEPMAT